MALLAVFVSLTAFAGCRKQRSTAPAPDGATIDQPPPPDPNTLKVSGVRLFGAGGRRWDAIFSRGERVVIRFLIQGLGAKARRIHVRTSLVVRGPEGSIFLRRPESTAIDRTVPVGKSTSLIEAAATLDLSRASPPGSYEATVTVRDVLGAKRAAVKASFQILGAPGVPATLTLRRFHAPPDLDLLAGLPLHVAFEVASFGTKAVPASKPAGGRGWKVHLSAKAVLRDGSGIELSTQTKSLLQQRLSFRATSLPVGWAIALPAKLKQGSYHLKITVKDHISGKTVERIHRFALLPGGLGIYGLRAQGDGGVGRKHFLRGERLNIHMHLRGWSQPTDTGIDVALVGPDNGVYLMRKKAHRWKDPKATGAMGRDLKIPLTIPEFAPNGRWLLKLRLRDFAGNAHSSRTLPFVVTGKALRPLPNLQVSGLVLRSWPGGPPIPGLFWRAGHTLHFDAVVGGMRLKNEQTHYHRTRLTCTLRLRNRAGEVQATLQKACQVDRRFSFVPLRLRLRTKWRIPSHLAGHHTFQFEVLDRLSDRVSVLQRGCFILIPRAKKRRPR